MISSDEDDVSYPFGVPPTKPGSCAIPMDHYPDRVCKDIPFKAYFYKQQSSPSTYLKFLKDLENSTSRLDFLFWLFDILCSGNPKSSFQEAVLNEVAGCFSQLSEYLKACLEDEDVKFCDHIKRCYPYVVRTDGSLFTYQSDDPELGEYRKKMAELIRSGKYEMPDKQWIVIDPMEGLTLEDFTPNPPEPHYDPAFNSDDEEGGGFKLALDYFCPVHEYTGQQEGSTDCILTDYNAYRRKQVEKGLKDASSLNVIIPRDKLPDDLKIGDLFVKNEVGDYVCCARAVDPQTLYDFFEIEAPPSNAPEELRFVWPTD